MSKDAEEKLRGMLEAAGLPIRGSYRSGEVLAILGIGRTTFYRLVSRVEKDDQGRLVYPDCLDTFELRSQRKVSYAELVAFLTRNNSYTRQHAPDPRQMSFDEILTA